MPKLFSPALSPDPMAIHKSLERKQQTPEGKSISQSYPFKQTYGIGEMKN